MANPAESGKSSMVSIGEKLRQAREKRALTVEQVQKQTRIHSTVITALEDGRPDEMLAPNYVKSFLREYANFLGLDSKELVSSYAALHPELNSRTANLSRLEPKNAEATIGVFRFLKRAVILILVVLLAVFLFNKAVKLFKSSDRHAKGGAPSSVAKSKTSKSASSSSGESFTQIPRSVPLTLVIRVKSPVMVQVKKDGVLLFKRVLQKGSVEALTATNNINIFVAKAESIELILNGKNLGSPGKGAIKSLEITRSGLRIK